MHRFTAGRSVEGQPVEVYEFNPGADDLLWDTLFIGVFHGDEGISGRLLRRFLEDIEANPDFTATCTNPFAILPVLNPDGLTRKTRLNANGVDLNRNYPTVDWLERDAGTDYYSGKAAASEPETRIVTDLLARYQPKKIITIHAPYEVINYDGPALDLANAMAKHCGYEVTGDIGYPTPGSFGTYAGKERQIPVITLELPETEDLSAVWPLHRESLYEAIRFGN